MKGATSQNLAPLYMKALSYPVNTIKLYSHSHVLCRLP